MFTCRSWESCKEKLQHYRRREPERSALYQLVYHGRDKLARVWEERFQATYGVLRDEILETFDAYLNCGILEHGAARVYCDTCKHSLLVSFSCKKRGVCPSCSAKRAVKFAEHLFENIIKGTQSRHIVFTIPKRLRTFLRYDRSLSTVLFSAAWGALNEVLGADGATPAAVLTIQTAGEALNHHPHLHGVLANGLFRADSTFASFETLDQATLTKRFTERVLAALHAKELIDDGVVSQILSQEHSGFSVWLGEPFVDADSKRFVARYIERGPVSLEKLSLHDDLVTYTTEDGKAHEFDALEFLALLSSHITKPYESVTRYYGAWSCRTRGKTRELIALGELHPDEKPARPSATWAACIKRMYEVDPLQCPKCKGQMRIVAFVKDGTEIKQLMHSLGLPDFRAPPKIKLPSLQQDLQQMPDYENLTQETGQN